MSPPLSVFLTPSGKFEASRVSSTLTSGLTRGLGVHAYHSLVGATNVGGTPRRIGWVTSSTLSRAGSDGQLLALKRLPPRNSPNHGHAWLPKPEMWNPSQAPPRCHVALERLALRRRVRHVVQPDHEPHVPQRHIVERVPVAGRREGVARLVGLRAERLHRLLCEEQMIQLATRSEKGQNPGARRGRVLAERRRGDKEQQRDETDLHRERRHACRRIIDRADPQAADCRPDVG